MPASRFVSRQLPPQLLELFGHLVDIHSALPASIHTIVKTGWITLIAKRNVRNESKLFGDTTSYNDVSTTLELWKQSSLSFAEQHLPCLDLNTHHLGNLHLENRRVLRDTFL